MKTVLCCLLLLTAGWLNATRGDARDESVAKYLAHVQTAQPSPPASLSPGSLWVDSGRMASLSADYKAMTVGDLITVVVVQGVISSNAGAVGTARTFNTSSGIDSVPVVGVGAAQSLLGLHSADTLSGKSQASSATSLTTTLAARGRSRLPRGDAVRDPQRLRTIQH